ncbi:MAG: Gfo/Idh/MocA family oxidoreductase [Isosphaeraceae bacterium]
MSQGEIRIGIVGAGQITRSKHLPGFRTIPGVRVVGVCNRHRESAVRVAREFDIPRIYGNWEELIQDPDVNAVVIGAWPYLHCPVTLAALDSGKHVLTQARMAMNAREAQRMLDKSTERPELTAMIVPSPYGLTGEAFVRSLIQDGFLGRLREVHVQSLNSDLADPDTPLGWRQMTRYSGFNMLTLGIVYETVLRWVVPANYVLAYASKQIEQRFDPELGKMARVGTPDSIQVLTSQESWPRRHLPAERPSLAPRKVLSQSPCTAARGTLIYDLLEDRIRGGRISTIPLRNADPGCLKGGWRGRGGLRGRDPGRASGDAHLVRRGRPPHAIHRSRRPQLPPSDAGHLALKEFSNPSL